MTKTDIATRVHNHTSKLDPIVRSLIDTDFYKLLMLQMIWKLYPEVDATFSLINRTKTVRLAEEIDEMELREQLDHARTLRLSRRRTSGLRVTPSTAARKSSSLNSSHGFRATNCPNTSFSSATGNMS